MPPGSPEYLTGDTQPTNVPSPVGASNLHSKVEPLSEDVKTKVRLPNGVESTVSGGGLYSKAPESHAGP